MKCNNKDAGALGSSLEQLLAGGAPRAEIDAFKLWLAFIDHGDTKTDNHKFSCRDSKKNPDGSRTCKPGQAVFYVADMGSTFGHSSASEKKATLNGWKGKDPIKVSAVAVRPRPREWAMQYQRSGSHAFGEWSATAARCREKQ